MVTNLPPQSDPISANFAPIAPGLGRGDPLPADWRRVTDLPLTILVGLTGVGKSTTLTALAETGIAFTLLPNRREVTDWLIITAMQALDGDPIQPVTDRTARFAFTRRYRARFPGGMAHALAQLSVDPVVWPGDLIFDGLRGAEEVTHAAAILPQARFVVLHAPDAVRVQRLLGRNDAFDRVASVSHKTSAGDIRSFADIGLPAAKEVFGPSQERALLALVHRGEVTAADLAAKLKIVVEERRNYDPDAAQSALQTLAPSRTLVVDTTRHSPTEAARLMAGFLS
ncbi:MAG: AAA family ATPase [Caldilineaceae bacterium]|nr:AAA family ATPase [Caldilineaceae bacterium]MBP8110435.1 AAA family ATPase [Caldilineaceae bacterium]MBP8125070.1 AAA family ATPase [Caldilineaceae bacterium]MBP9072323.1 AAA family ATPase [Caldilineaceae bacterium]